MAWCVGTVGWIMTVNVAGPLLGGVAICMRVAVIQLNGHAEYGMPLGLHVRQRQEIVRNPSKRGGEYDRSREEDKKKRLLAAEERHGQQAIKPELKDGQHQSNEPRFLAMRATVP